MNNRNGLKPQRKRLLNCPSKRGHQRPQSLRESKSNNNKEERREELLMVCNYFRTVTL